MRRFTEPAMVEACLVYGFATPPDPVTLSIRQVEIIESIAGALERAVHRERQRILRYLELHEYDIASGVLDPITALRRELASGHP